MVSIVDTISIFIRNHHKSELESASEDSETLIELDYHNFNEFLKENTTTTCFGKNFINTMQAVEKKFKKDYGKDFIFKVIDYPTSTLIRTLDSKSIGKFITTTAMIKNITPIRLNLVVATYECRNCGKYHQMKMTSEIAKLPVKCEDCGGKSFQLLNESSIYEDYKYIKLEEPLELRIGGESREFKAKVEGYLASPYYTLKPGDVCDVAGELTVHFDEKKKIVEPFFDIWHIKPLNSAYEEIKLSEEDIEEIEELSQDKDIFNKFVNSIAPETYGYEYIKEGLVLQMFEGDRPKDNQLTNKDRHTIHILLIGDPGIGKSKLIESVYDNCPKSIKANGAGTSQSGLTASAVKDELVGSWSLEAGAIILADGGLLTVDEFDKLSKNVMLSLNEPMEQLSVSVAKAGLVQTMTARTSVLAGANPKYSKFDKYKPFGEQLNIPQSTISRFDLIYALNDDIDYDTDLEKSYKVLKNDFSNDSETLDKDLIKKYVNYAKNTVYPELSDEAIKHISEFYAKTRAMSLEYDDLGKPITLRELGAITRLAIAKAKVELRDWVTVNDAEEAIRIYAKSLESLGLNPLTVGEIQNIYSKQEIEIISYAEESILESIVDDRIDKESIDEIKLNLRMKFNVKVDKVNKLFDIALENVIENN